jgi:hypothetical protein
MGSVTILGFHISVIRQTKPKPIHSWGSKWKPKAPIRTGPVRHILPSEMPIFKVPQKLQYWEK